MSDEHAGGFALARAGWGAIPRPAPSAVDWQMPGIDVETRGAGRDARYLRELDGFLTSKAPDVDMPRPGDEDAPGSTWLGEVYSLVARDQPDAAIDILFDHVDALLLASQFERCDGLFLAIDLKRLDTNLLIGLLSITLRAADKLPGRKRLAARVEARLATLAPNRAERLLTGLR